jgi:hypothetical protein
MEISLPWVRSRYQRIEVPVLDEGEQLLNRSHLERIRSQEHDRQAERLEVCLRVLGSMNGGIVKEYGGCLAPVGVIAVKVADEINYE